MFINLVLVLVHVLLCWLSYSLVFIMGKKVVDELLADKINITIK